MIKSYLNHEANALVSGLLEFSAAAYLVALAWEMR